MGIKTGDLEYVTNAEATTALVPYKDVSIVCPAWATT